MVATLTYTRGVLALVGPLVEELAREGQLQAQTITNDTALNASQPYHITLLTKAELRDLPHERVENLQPDVRHIFSAGVGGNRESGVFCVVIIWAAGQQLRRQLGLSPKQFHITLSANDKHEMDKGIESLFPNQFPAHPASEFLDHLAFTLHASGNYQKAREYAIQLISREPDVTKGYLRLADSALGDLLHKLAMLAYACAHRRAEDEKVQTYCIKKLIDCSKTTEWGPVFQEQEIQQVPEEVKSYLLEPWSVSLREALSDKVMIPTLHLAPRDSLFIPFPSAVTTDNGFYKLPRFFRWLIPHSLAIMSTPRCEGDIMALASPRLGIRHVLTLTEETPLPRSWFHGKPITNTYLPVPNYQPPTIEQMDLVINLLSDRSKAPTLIHCGGGKGRAGTVAACYMVAFGSGPPQFELSQPTMSATDAIYTLRSIRPGSIETPQQERFVSQWCSTIWKCQSVYPDRPSEPSPSPLTIEGLQLNAADLFVLVGLPGSGKSWVSNALLARNAAGWIRISQDECGSRSACEAQIGLSPHGQRVLLDRCNTAASDRKEWLKLASNWCNEPVCVWFDYDRDLCLSRAQMRAGHSTLPPGSRVRNAVNQMHKVFVRPSLQEGFKAVVIIRSFAAAQELVLRLSPVNIYKFPRTPHIINLGAATSDDISVTLPGSIEGHVIITEKLDGANMGFSLSSDGSQIVVQNRSHYVNPASHEQFKKLGNWTDQHREDLLRVLNRDPYFPQRYILFGEWLYAIHSIAYTHLPDRFMAYDLYDRNTDTFMDRRRLENLLSQTSICMVPVIYEGQKMPSESEFRLMVQTQSNFWNGRVEGVYVKIEWEGKVRFRGKVVRSDFIAGNEHWTKGPLRVNELASSTN